VIVVVDQMISIDIYSSIDHSLPSMPAIPYTILDNDGLYYGPVWFTPEKMV